MSQTRATKETGERPDAEAGRDERPVEERAEEIVERVSEQAALFARRLVARAREELEDIVAEAQNLRRGGPSRE